MAAPPGAPKRPLTKQEKEISLILEACQRSGYQTNGYANHVFEKMHRGEQEHGVDTYKGKDIFKELMDEAADLAGWSLLEFHELDELNKLDPGNAKIHYLKEVLKKVMESAAVVHTMLSQSAEMKRELQNEVSAISSKT